MFAHYALPAFELAIFLVIAHRLHRRPQGVPFRELIIGCSICIACVTTTIFYLYPTWLEFANLPVHGTAWRFVAALFFCGGLQLVIYSRRAIGKNFVGGVGLNKKHQLVTHGPYHFVRNPIYVGYGIIALGFGIVSANWVATLGNSIPFLLFFLRVPQEEKILEKRFGNAYRKYKATTPRFFPRFAKRKKPSRF